MPSIAPPTSWPTRSFISRAALLVKVTARISFGRARPVLQQMGEPGGQRRGLAGAGAGEHQHRPVERLDRRALRRVQVVEIGRGRAAIARADSGRSAASKASASSVDQVLMSPEGNRGKEKRKARVRAVFADRRYILR